ncbi:hypothetical protein C7I86_06330 [Synechocystis sp. IPPAS B-1465]|nr:hypothetical protein C7I86_06330 [Synechocystis sp. IPPAS B-1465]
MKEFLMTYDNTDPKQHSSLKVIYRFLGGATVGALVLLIPVTYSTFDNFGLVQVGVASLLVTLCGLLSIVWGEKFIDVVMRMLNGTGL